MGDIVEGRHDALSTRDADVHAMLRQLRHEYDILQREKREMEIYCDDVLCPALLCVYICVYLCLAASFIVVDADAVSTKSLAEKFVL
eukprot:m.1324578 g.1324578  ORF g.1324578 m.1324578 type:complete len:87 (-) comp24852_c2_seq16:5457-5717(-)